MWVGARRVSRQEDPRALMLVDVCCEGLGVSAQHGLPGVREVEEEARALGGGGDGVGQLVGGGVSGQCVESDGSDLVRKCGVRA